MQCNGSAFLIAEGDKQGARYGRRSREPKENETRKTSRSTKIYEGEIYARSKKSQGNAEWRLLPLVDSLAATVRNLHTVLQVAVDIHQAPVVFPTLFLGVELDLPGLIKGLEPARRLANVRCCRCC
jgi:hypothetical protein